MSVSSQKTTLYRAYNSENELLYVGISHSVMARIGQHKSAGVWHGKCVRITLEHFANRELARKAENKAIKKEYPIYNKQGKPTGVDDYWKNKRQQELLETRDGELDITVAPPIMIDPPNLTGSYTGGSAAELNYSEHLRLPLVKHYVANKLGISAELYDKCDKESQATLTKYGRKYYANDLKKMGL